MTSELQPHIQLTKEHNVQYALLPGDPSRVDRVKEYLTDAEEIGWNREYKSVIGYYMGVKILVISTGIGGPSTGIAIEELKNIGVKHLIRIGSSGALQPHLRLGDLIIATGAVRNDGTSDAYIEKGYPAIANTELVTSLKLEADRMNYSNHLGLVRSHDSFYTDHEEETDQYWHKQGILGSDMETATLFVVGSLRGLQTASILNIVVPYSGDLETGINQYVTGESVTTMGEKRQIHVALEAIASYHKKQI